jgi:redox-regulated HSP33 family molecular chaperone
MILKEVEGEFSTEDETIHVALMFCQKMYETPTSRAYKGIASMLDRLARYMETTTITAGRDGNINSLIAAAKNFDQIRASFKGAYKDLQEEQSSKVRGGIGLSYDS